MGRAEAERAVSVEEPLQPDLGQLDGLDIHAQYGSERTGGDFFDAARIGRRVAFLLSDVAGRRPELDPIVAAMQDAFRSSSAQLFRKGDANLMESTELLVQAVNHALVAVAGVRFAPTLIGCYDLQLGVLAYINAGGKTALMCDSEGTRPLPNVSMPLGLFPHLTYDASMQAFEPGAMLLVVTKGVTESMGGKNALAPEKLIEVLSGSGQESASGVCKVVLDAAFESQKRRGRWLPFQRKSKPEDMTALAIVRLLKSERPKT